MELHAALSADPGQVAVARRLLRRYLAERTDRADPRSADRSFDRHDVPVLLVSELVTNAIRHAQPPLELHAATVGSGLRVEVHDGASDPPVLAAPTPMTEVPPESGRGLFLVASLADRWGWDGNPTGKAVWFELDAL